MFKQMNQEIEQNLTQNSEDSLRINSCDDFINQDYSFGNRPIKSEKYGRQSMNVIRAESTNYTSEISKDQSLVNQSDSVGSLFNNSYPHSFSDNQYQINQQQINQNKICQQINYGNYLQQNNHQSINQGTQNHFQSDQNEIEQEEEQQQEICNCKYLNSYQKQLQKHQQQPNYFNDDIQIDKNYLQPQNSIGSQRQFINQQQQVQQNRKPINKNLEYLINESVLFLEQSSEYEYNFQLYSLFSLNTIIDEKEFAITPDSTYEEVFQWYKGTAQIYSFNRDLDNLSNSISEIYCLTDDHKKEIKRMLAVYTHMIRIKLVPCIVVQGMISDQQLRFAIEDIQIPKNVQEFYDIGENFMPDRLKKKQKYYLTYSYQNQSSNVEINPMIQIKLKSLNRDQIIPILLKQSIISKSYSYFILQPKMLSRFSHYVESIPFNPLPVNHVRYIIPELINKTKTYIDFFNGYNNTCLLRAIMLPLLVNSGQIKDSKWRHKKENYGGDFGEVSDLFILFESKLVLYNEERYMGFLHDDNTSRIIPPIKSSANEIVPLVSKSRLDPDLQFQLAEHQGLLIFKNESNIHWESDYYFKGNWYTNSNVERKWTQFVFFIFGTQITELQNENNKPLPPLVFKELETQNPIQLTDHPQDSMNHSFFFMSKSAHFWRVENII